MAIDIGELRAVLTLKDDFSKPINDCSKELGFFSSSFGAVTGALGAGVGAITATGAAILKLGESGAEIADVSDAFDQLAGGTDNATDMLGKLREGTLGTIRDFDLMATANRALGAGVRLSADDMGVLAKGAQMLADRTGKDTKNALDALTQSLITGRTKGLAEFGFGVEKGGSLLDTLKKQLDVAGPASRDFADNISAGKVAVENFTDNLSVAIARSPVLNVALAAISDGLSQAFGGNKKEVIQTLIGYVNQFAIWLAKAADVGVSAAQFLTNVFNGLKFVLNTVLEVLAKDIGNVAGMLATIAEKASGIPGVGAAFKGVGVELRGVSDFAKSLAIGFHETGQKALDSAATANSGFQKVHGVLGSVISKMQDASKEQVKLNTAVSGLGKATAEASKRSDSDLKAIKDHFTKLQNDLTLANKVGVDRRLKEAANAFTAERQRIAELKNATLAERAEMTLLAEANYKKQVAAAKLGSDQIRDTMQKLDSDILKSKTTGLAAQLLAISDEQAQELKGIENLKLEYGAAYDAIKAKAIEKASILKQSAIDASIGEIETVNKTKNVTIDAADANLRAATRTYDAAARAGWKSAEEEIRARKAVEAASQQLREAQKKSTEEQWQETAAMASGALREIFGKSKAAAIASIIIDTGLAIMKVWSTSPNFYVGLAQSIIVGAIGAANLSKASSATYREGTPGLGYVDFGPETDAKLHDVEAVVPRAKVPGLASDIAGELSAGGGRGSRPIEITLVNQLDGKVLTRRLIRLMPHELSLVGAAV